MILNLHILTAAALAGVDLAANDRNNVSSQPRALSAVAVAGSVAVNDFYVEVFIGNVFVGRFYNTKPAGTQINLAEDMRPTGRKFIPVGAKVSVIAGMNAGAGNVDVLII